MNSERIPVTIALLAMFAAVFSPPASAAPPGADTASEPTDTSLWQSFWIGVGAGAAASAATYIIYLVLKAAVLWAYGEWSRRRAEEQLIDVSGTWDGSDVAKDDYTYKEVVKLQQKGEHIEGTLDYIQTGPGSEPVRKLFKLDGIYRERSLTVSYRTADRRSISTGCIAMHLKGDGQMKGGCIYYDGDSGDIVHDQYTWTRRE